MDSFKRRLAPKARISVELAVWFHDAIYDPLSPLNEAKSAELAKTALWADGGRRRLAEEVSELVMATLHTSPPRTLRAKWVCDLDLSSLGLPLEDYILNSGRIRHEYKSVPDEKFYPGRAKVLQSFLDRKHIYQLVHFRDMFENVARTNMTKEIESIARRGFSTAGTTG